ncbi:MAG: DEAD/DEAH box helicase, partial [Pirellulaceae bacterium]|nr:DEAD/DEAH box helicase [Pirellulaceae bacterium]
EGNFQVGNKSVKLSEVMAWLNEATFPTLRTAAKSTNKTFSDSDRDTLMESINASIHGDYIRLGEHGWAKITRELRDNLRKLTDVVHPSRGIMHFDASAAPMIRQLHTHMQVDYTQEWQNCLDRLSSAEQLTPVLPTTLKAELRDYQLAGFQWLQRLAHWGVGGVLADDMGLGKTVQTLAVIVDRATAGPTLVIAPTSVAFNWMREVERFAPHLQAQLYRQTDRDDVLKHMQPEQLIVCSYGLALRDAKKLAAVNWTTLVLDEAQAIKNSRSKTSQAITAINADWKVALTGTPVENHLGELWSLFSVISPGVFGSWEQFRDKFAAPIERDGDQERRQALGERIRPFVLRRTKSEVLRDLPARTEMNIEVELSSAERKLYDATRLLMLKEADLIVASPDVQEQRFKLLALLTRLRQLACNPRMVDQTWTEESAKLQQLRDTLLELRAEGHRVLVFSQFVKHLTLIREMLDSQQITYQYLDGSTPAAQRQQQVDLFQNGSATAFLISLKAGGTGLNRTAADYVIHMDPWWNPAVEDQASDRAHRIGQTKPVMVYRIIAKDTIEEEILKLHEDKRDLVAGVLEGTHMAGQMSTKDLIALLHG